MSHDCNVTSDDADNPNIKCTRKEVKETHRFIRWVMTTSEQNGNVMPSILAHYKGKQSSKSRSKSTPDDWSHHISQNHIMPALFDHDFGGNRERVYLVLVHLKSFISSVSAWTIEVYIDISIPILLCPMSFS